MTHLSLALATCTATLLIVAPQALAAASATTNPATKVHHTSAVLNGHLDPDADPGITECHFDWGTSAAYGSTVPCNEGSSFGAPADVSANLGFLTPETTYHFRLHVTTTSSGELTGSDESFTPSQFPADAPEIAAFGPDGTSGSDFKDSEFPGVSQLALNQADHRLYAVSGNEPANDPPGAIYGFDVSALPNTSLLGDFSPLETAATGVGPDIAVDSSSTASTGNVYFVSDITHLIHGYDSTGAPLGGNFPINIKANPGPPGPATVPRGVAVDAASDLWVADLVRRAIFHYNSSGVHLSTVSVAAQIFQGSPTDLTLDPNGDLYVALVGEDPGIWRYTATSGYTAGSEVVHGIHRAIAVDPSTRHLYVADKSTVSEYDPTGALIGTFTPQVPSASFQGIAVDAASHDIYLSDGGNTISIPHKIHVYGQPTIMQIPTLTPEAPSAIGPTSTTLNAAVDPEGMAVTDCHFDYGPTEAYGQSAPCAPDPGSGSGDVAVSAALAGLTPEHAYHFRIVAANSHGASKGKDQLFFTPPAVKGLSTQPATEISAIGATLNGTLDPNGAAIGDCHFSYVKETDFNATGFAGATDVPCAPPPGSGSGAVAVSAAVSDLEPGTGYRFRLQATNSFGTTVGGALAFFTVGPRVSGTVANPVGDTRATLRASVNPQGLDTTYHFEYGTTTSYGSSTPESAPVGSDGADHPALAEVAGLAPSTTYHFRAVATNGNGVSHGPDATFITYATASGFEACPNDEFRTGASAHLPDCRAYEQASPVDKNGADIIGEVFKVQASLSGDAVTFLVNAGVPGGAGAQNFPLYVARRGAARWSTQSLLPPPQYGVAAKYAGWTPDLNYALDSVDFFGAAPSGAGLVSVSTRDGSVQQMADYTNGASYALVGASADGSKVFFEATASTGGLALPPGAPEPAAGKDNLYRFDRDTGTLSLVGLLPDSACGAPPCVPAAGSFAGPFDWWNGTDATTLGRGGALGGYFTQEMHAVSTDGGRAFFTAGKTGQIYLRQGLNGPAPSTVQVSASQRLTPDPNGAKPAAFISATPSGSIAFLTSCEKLTDDSTAVSTVASTCATAEQGSDLYAYDAASGELTDLTVDHAGNPRGADVRGVIGASDDGSYVYFVANGDLDDTGSATLGNCKGTNANTSTLSGACNLYLAHDGTIEFLARLDSSGDDGLSDAASWAPSQDRANKNSARPVGSSTGRVSTDGQTLLIRSHRQLTAYDNKGTTEFYRFRLGVAEPDCVTCNPTGVPPSASPTFQTISTLAIGSTVQPFLIRLFSSDGNRVFFETTEKLLAADTNGDAGCPVFFGAGARSCQDVYEWEADGSGSCHSASGCLYLLSTGTSAYPSFLGDASASGDDVFIFTRDPLVPQDTDAIQDVYDVRVGGGLPGQNEVAPPRCEGESCRGAGTAAPPVTGAGSAVFHGDGNPPVRRQHKKHRKKRHHGRAHKRTHSHRGGAK
jgi:hypothetical protein